MRNKLLPPQEVVKISKIEDRLKCCDFYYQNPEEIKNDLKYYMEIHRIPFLEETARLAIYPGDIKRFKCTLDILDNILQYAKDPDFRKFVLDYKTKTEKLKTDFLRKISKK